MGNNKYGTCPQLNEDLTVYGTSEPEKAKGVKTYTYLSASTGAKPLAQKIQFSWNPRFLIKNIKIQYIT
ncbi:hypothetical protein [Clostridium sp. BJN0013]|uniref:hypothetical protein n=1 Tax=Clostridium sp. BJN0013 TaxID=3236840 RepID=UPI0034C60540